MLMARCRSRTLQLKCLKHIGAGCPDVRRNPNDPGFGVNPKIDHLQSLTELIPQRPQRRPPSSRKRRARRSPSSSQHGTSRARAAAGASASRSFRSPRHAISHGAQHNRELVRGRCRRGRRPVPLGRGVGADSRAWAAPSGAPSQREGATQCPHIAHAARDGQRKIGQRRCMQKALRAQRAPRLLGGCRLGLCAAWGVRAPPHRPPHGLSPPHCGARQWLTRRRGPIACATGGAPPIAPGAGQPAPAQQ